MLGPLKVILITSALAAVAVIAAGCGTQKVTASKSDPTTYSGAVLFKQRCSGCHTLSYAAARGSASNVRSREIVNGPNFNVRCERPVTRVLYAIENGGFSGAIMPQNIVVGQQARDVAQFVATYAGRASPKSPGVPSCQTESIGTLPSPTATTASGAPAVAPSASTTTGTTTAPGTP